MISLPQDGEVDHHKCYTIKVSKGTPKLVVLILKFVSVMGGISQAY
jgi:hypothetical protein